VKIKVTWEGNTDGSLRVVPLGSRRVYLWVSVQNESDCALPPPCGVEARAIEILPARLWRYAVTQLRHLDPPKPLSLPVVRTDEDRAEFRVDGLPSPFFPYWIEIRAQAKPGLDETVTIFAVPRLNRVVSTLFLTMGGLLAVYGAWLMIQLTSDTTPRSLSTFAETSIAILAPLAGAILPFLSTTVRRFLYDSRASGFAAVVALVFVVAMHRWKQPLYIENDTPGTLGVLDGNYITQEPQTPQKGGISSPSNSTSALAIEPGGAAVIASEQIDPALVRFLNCQDSTCEPPSWFSAAQFCVRRLNSESDRCLALRPAGLLTRFQRWLSLGRGVRIGCKAIDNLDPDAIAQWEKSGSCRHDPALEVVRTLHEHLIRVKEKDQGAPVACAEPMGQVKLRPFREAILPGNGHAMKPRRLIMPSSKDQQGTLPSWRFVSNGPLAEISLSPARGVDGTCCAIQYPVNCGNGAAGCSGLLIPMAEVSASLLVGEQQIGTLWCAPNATNVYTIRLRSRLLGFNVFTDDANPTKRDLMSRFESTSDATGGWVAWCEAVESVEEGPAPSRQFSAEVLLPSDWQPVLEWTWPIPRGSLIGELSIVLKEKGRWGTLTCPPKATASRSLELLAMSSGPGRVLSGATREDAKWERYIESSVFPRWGWMCAVDDGDSVGKKNDKVVIKATVDDRSHGVLDPKNRQFQASGGDACVIDPETGSRVDTVKHGMVGPPARSVVAERGIANCDPNRSIFRERTTSSKQASN